MSLWAVVLALCMPMACRMLSVLSLVVVWLFCAPSVDSVFEFLAAAVGFRPTVFSGWGVGLVYWSVRILCSDGDIHLGIVVDLCS